MLVTNMDSWLPSIFAPVSTTCTTGGRLLCGVMGRPASARGAASTIIPTSIGPTNFRFIRSLLPRSETEGSSEAEPEPETHEPRVAVQVGIRLGEVVDGLSRRAVLRQERLSRLGVQPVGRLRRAGRFVDGQRVLLVEHVEHPDVGVERLAGQAEAL